MARQSIQTTTSIKWLKEIGLSRSDFSVRTPKNKYGENEATEITIYLSTDKMIELIPQFAEKGFYVTRMVKEATGQEFRPTVHYWKPYPWTGGVSKIQVLKF